MRILILHNLYQLHGGEDVVVAAEAELLRGGGHEVHIELVSNSSIRSTIAKVRSFLFAPFDPSRKVWMKELIARYRPDIVHIHNFFPLLTPAVHEAAAEAGLGVVQTLHNHRIICANSHFLRNGIICEKCLHGSKLWCLKYRCYRGSLFGSFAVLRLQRRIARDRSWTQHVGRFIALTASSRDRFVADGMPLELIAVKPNFVADTECSARREREGALFVGRLTREKGADVLVRAWKDLPDIPLTIVGDGPERADLEAKAPPHVRFLGQRAAKEVRALMNSAGALVVPSLCYESFGLTIVEAFACGLPVIASRLGAFQELVEHGRTGVFFTPGDAVDLAQVARRAFAERRHLAAMGDEARATYVRFYTPETNLEMLEKIYVEARELAIHSRNIVSRPS